MAFFGLTQLGYQNPIGDKMILNSRGEFLSPEKQGTLRHEDTHKVLVQPPSFTTDEHHRSHKQYREIVQRAQTTRSPDQLYIMPLTDNQQYGWMLSKSSEPWTQVRRFPRRNSELTKFVHEMSKRDPNVSLF